MRLRFVAAGAAQGLVHALAAENGIEVEGSFGAVGAMLERFDAGEPCDVVILTRAQIERLAAQQRILAQPQGDLGAAPTAIAVRHGEAAPDVSSASALRQALLDADAIYFPDPAKATAGIHFAKVIDLLGIRAALEPRLRTFPNGTTAMRALALASGHPIGCTQATEILASAGVDLVAALPAGLDLATVYTAAVSAQAREPLAAARFVEQLSGESSRARRRSAGFQ